jgi:hypothetical protein
MRLPIGPCIVSSTHNVFQPNKSQVVPQERINQDKHALHRSAMASDQPCVSTMRDQRIGKPAHRRGELDQMSATFDFDLRRQPPAMMKLSDGGIAAMRDRLRQSRESYSRADE